MVNKEFIKVTAQYDGKPAYIRATLIESVVDNDEQRDGETIRLACRTVNYAGRSINVIEEADDIMDMIYNAEL